jgi:hypothetical protein
VPFTRPPFAAAPLRCASTLALPPRRVVSSFPLSWRSPRCFYAMHDYKRSHPLRLVRTSVVSASGKPSPPHSPLFSATSSVPSHLTPPLSSYAGPRASPEPRAAPQPEGPTPSPLLSSVVHPPRFDLASGTVSVKCTEIHGCFLWTSSRGSSSRRPSLAAPVPRAARRVDLDVVCSLPLLRATPC